ncbi:MAG: permease [Actinobacteria bacterium]|nr:permease [Actinomycetota bacterium]
MILGLGCIAHDQVLITSALWEDGKGRILRTESRFGGNVRTALAAGAGLGERVEYLATVGADEQWDAALADLAEHGVGTEFTVRAPGVRPVMSTIVVTRDGDRFIAYDDSGLFDTPLPDRALVERALARASVLIVDSSTAPPGSAGVIAMAIERGIPVVLDAEREVPGSTVVEDMIAIADHPILPMNFARHVTGAQQARDIIEALWSGSRSAVVLTDGANGALVRGPGDEQPFEVPAFAVAAVDTVGCGDAFHGAYAVGLARGLALVDRVRLANAAAAVVAATPAGQRRTPTMAAVTALMSP